MNNFSNERNGNQKEAIMSLNTNLQHIESDADFTRVLAENENVMITCGRMGPMCLPVYDVMEALQRKYPHVAFRDMSFDGPAAHNIKSLPQVRHFTGLPFVVYFKNGQVVEAVSSIQSKQAVKAVLDKQFTEPIAKAS
jgi:thioredoxin 1